METWGMGSSGERKMSGTDTIFESVRRPVEAGAGRQKSAIGRLRHRLGQYAAGISTAALTVSVAAMAMAQQQNIYMKEAGAQFKAAPAPPPTEVEADAAAEAAALVGDTIFGMPVNTIFFVTAGVIALFWFTIGGGRKPKVAPRS
jgi:hypothetical protein